MITTAGSLISSLVTSLWDLGSDWIHSFWSTSATVENKTADAQLMLNQMSEAETKKVSQSPGEWMKEKMTFLVSEMNSWMKDDVFCEQWEGVPRFSKCLVPNKTWDCTTCTAQINGLCSLRGVVLPSFVTGLIAGAGSGAVSEAGSLIKIVRAQKTYTQMAKAVDKLAQVEALRRGLVVVKAGARAVKVATAPGISVLSKTSSYVKEAYQKLLASPSYLSAQKGLEKAAKYSGVKAVAKADSDMFEAGFEAMDETFALGKKVIPKKVAVLNRFVRRDKAMIETQKALKPLYQDLTLAHKTNRKLRLLEKEMHQLEGTQPLSAEAAEKLKKLELEAMGLDEELNLINDRYLRATHALYVKDGIPSKIVGSNKGIYLELDFSTPPTGERAFEFYRKIQQRFGVDKVTLNLKENVRNSSGGFFSENAKRIEMGPNQGFSLLDDYFNSVSKHESRHAMFSAKRVAGDDSTF
jgi:hypothetical protein